MLNKLNNSNLTPPADKSIKTLYIGNLNPTIREEDLRNAFYSYGELMEVNISPKLTFAFLTYTTREAAEKAVQKIGGGGLNVNGVDVKVGWKKPTPLDGTPSNNNNNNNNTQSTSSSSQSKGTFAIPPPPNPNNSNQPLYASMNPQQFGSRDR